MKTVKAVLYGKPVRCPACGTLLTNGITLRLGCEREIGQDKVDDYPPQETEP